MVLKRFTSREWKINNFMPSFGLIGNQGYRTRHYSAIKAFGAYYRFSRLIYYNEFEPIVIG